MEDRTTTKPAGGRYFKKQLVIPTEHGSWSWLLVPYFVGVLVAGDWNLAAFLVLVGGLAGFLVRQPAVSWMRIRSGRGRKADLALAKAWTLGLATIALLSFAGLLFLDRAMLLWLLIPMVAIFAFYLAASRQRRASVRSLWMEIAGAAGLAATTPAAYTAASGSLDATAWTLWALMAGQNMLGVLYVRLRIADTHGREMARGPVLWSHGAVLLAVLIAAALEAVPWLAAVPFAGYSARAVWAVYEVRAVDNIVRFGFSEIGAEIAGGVLIVLGYWLV